MQMTIKEALEALEVLHELRYQATDTPKPSPEWITYNNAINNILEKIKNTEIK